jgi:hypothetical protein
MATASLTETDSVTSRLLILLADASSVRTTASSRLLKEYFIRSRVSVRVTVSERLTEMILAINGIISLIRAIDGNPYHGISHYLPKDST